jgi:S-adenosylmethionine synthetase
MFLREGLFTSESVADGHPDKFCDQVSDAMLDACLAEDPSSRVAVEVAAKGAKVWVFGELTTRANPDAPAIVREVARAIGHTGARWGIDAESLRVDVDLSVQAHEIQFGADRVGARVDARTQATASDTARREPRAGRECQVTVEYASGKPARIRTVVVSTQHDGDLPQAKVREKVVEEIIHRVLPRALANRVTVHVNPGGPFVEGGPLADAGLTGRKIIVDTYGGYARHGGGAFSGKDATKVDRSAAYAARQLSREIVARGWATQCEVRLAYAIGVAEPVAIGIETFGTETQGADIRALAKPALFTPGAIIERLGLRAPIFRRTAAFGHFGRPGFPWEGRLAVVEGGDT